MITSLAAVTLVAASVLSCPVDHRRTERHQTHQPEFSLL
jgi:hypothetical protein